MTVTAEQVRDAMVKAGVVVVDHHDCAICGGLVYYARKGNQLFFNPHCGCAGDGPLEPRTWQDAADWINMQTPEWQVKIASRFGLSL